jgi:hypothetical protein
MGLVARAQAMKKFSIARQADALLDVWSRSLKEAAA